MKALRNYLDKIKPNFEKGGKYEKLQSTFDAIETFLYVPKKVTFNFVAFAGALKLKLPDTSVIAPTVVPTTTTEAPGTALPSSLLVTVPLIIFCARTTCIPPKRSKTSRIIS